MATRYPAGLGWKTGKFPGLAGSLMVIIRTLNVWMREQCNCSEKCTVEVP